MQHDANNTNWCQSVTGVVIVDGKVLLARHTYGSGKGRLIVPGGYVQKGEMPTDAVKREVYEETGIAVEPERIIAARFNERDWYIAFAARYVSGTARSDGEENDLVVWMDLHEALSREDVPDLTKKLILCAQSENAGLEPIAYTSRAGKGILFGLVP